MDVSGGLQPRRFRETPNTSTARRLSSAASKRGFGMQLRQMRRPAGWLAVVAVAYTVTMLLVVAPRSTISWDEAVYASQVNPRTPAAFFSAPRARGVTYLIAPVVYFTDSTPALRAYLAVIAGILLLAAYWPWLRVFRRPGLVPLAALLFAGLWVVLFYGTMAMPNAWVAFGAVAATGWFVRYGRDRSFNALVGFAVALAFIAVVRPSDAFWVLLPIVGAMVVARRWRRLGPWLACGAGLAAGLAPWLIESYLRFGGPLARLERANEIQGDLGWYPRTVLYQLTSVNGPLICRPCSTGLSDLSRFPLSVYIVWWLAIPILTVVGLVIAARRRELAAMAIPALAGASIGLSYLLLVGYAAPRFLIPAYALLALPVACGLHWLPRAVPARVRPWAVVALGTCIALHITSQVYVLQHRFDGINGGKRDLQATAALTRMGVTPPCAVLGVDDIPIAYHTHCQAFSFKGANKNMTLDELPEITQRMRTAFVTRRPVPPRYLDGWHRTTLPVVYRHGRPWYAYTPPGQ